MMSQVVRFATRIPTEAPMSTGHIIVDGYNVIHAWPDLRALLRRSTDAAAARLLDALRILHDFEGQSLTLVFDGKGACLTIEQTDGLETLTVVHSPGGVTADTVIERLLARAPVIDGWVVATGDGAVAQTATSYAARAISPDALATWCNEAARRQSDWIRRRSKAID